MHFIDDFRGADTLADIVQIAENIGYRFGNCSAMLVKLGLGRRLGRGLRDVVRLLQQVPCSLKQVAATLGFFGGYRNTSVYASVKLVQLTDVLAQTSDQILYLFGFIGGFLRNILEPFFQSVRNVFQAVAQQLNA
ncbi:MAG: hypothetical protein EA406_14555 [Rhodospirillales bacterium]|nr:MAG: hypothetical protein EA406_14555 [Rhodospirillales bacterium]